MYSVGTVLNSVLENWKSYMLPPHTEIGNYERGWMCNYDNNHFVVRTWGKSSHCASETYIYVNTLSIKLEKREQWEAGLGFFSEGDAILVVCGGGCEHQGGRGAPAGER